MSRPDDARTQHENHLFERFRRSRDAHALAAFFDAVAPDLARIASHLGTRSTGSDDLVQDAFLIAIERPGAWRGEGSAFAWLVGVVHRLALAGRRRERRALLVSAEEATREDPALDPVAATELAELRETLAARLRELPEPYATVLRLHLVEGRSASEIAAVLAAPPGTIRTQLVRGLERIRRGWPLGVSLRTSVPCGGPRLAGIRAVILARASGRARGVATLALVAVGGVLGWLVCVHPAAPHPGALEAALPATCTVTQSRELEDPVATSAWDLRTRVFGPPESSAGASGSELLVHVLGTAGAPGSCPEHPLRDVLVRAWQPGAGRGVPADEAPCDVKLHEARTDADGVARLPRLTGGPVHLSFHPRGGIFVVPSATNVLEGNATTSWTHRIEHVDRVDGEVCDEDGRPVPGAKITLVRGEFTDLECGRSGRLAAETGDDGRFLAPRVNGEHQIAVAAAGFAPAFVRELGTRAPVRVRLSRARGAVQVRCLDRQGLPRPGVVVRVRWAGSELPLAVTSDAEGVASFQDLALGEHEFSVRTSSGFDAKPRLLTIADPGPRELVLEVAVAASLAGVLRDGDGRPVAGTWVEAIDAGADGKLVVARCRSLEDGRFALPLLPLRPLRVVAVLAGRALLDEPLQLGEAETRFGDLVMSPLGTLRGRVRGLAADECSHFEVRALAEGWTPARRVDLPRVRSARLAPDGSFEFRALPFAAHRVIVCARDADEHGARAASAGILPGRGDVTLTVE